MLAAILLVVVGFASIAVPQSFFLSHVEQEGKASAQFTSNGCPVDRAWSDDLLAAALGVAEAKVRKLHDIRGLTAAEICTMPPDKLARALVKVDEPKPDQPGEAARFRAMQQASDDGRVRPDGLVNALSERAAIVPRFGREVAGIDKSSWTAIGPDNVGGRVRAILTDPADPNHLLAGSVAGGIWKSVNGGTSWTPVNDFMANVAISTLVRDPSNPQRIYAGTGEGFYNYDYIRGYGAFVSTDGGTNWSQLGGTVPDVSSPPATQQSDFLLVNRIAVHPTNPAIVLVATSGYYCNWGGVYRSTNATSANPTWTRVYDRRALDVRFDPNDGNHVIVGEGSHCAPVAPYPPDGGAVAYSANAGLSFTRVPLDVTPSRGRVEVAWAPATSGLAVAVTEGNGGSGGDGRFWVSTNAGQTWAFNSQPGHLSGQGWYNNALWVDPTDSKRIVVGGLDVYRGAGAVNWWATNTAIPWTKITAWYIGGSVHADNHALVPSSNYDGTGNRVMYIGNDGGVYKSADIASHNGVDFTANWTNLNNGLQVTQYYSGAGRSGYPGGATRIVGGTQDNGSLKAPASGSTWSTFFGGDGGYSAVDPSDPNYYYGEYVYAQVHRATTGGNASYIYGGPNPITEASTGEANFIAPFILDPNSVNTLLVGAKSLWRSADVKAATPHWSAIKSADPTASNYISAIAVATGSADRVWIGHNNGAVYCTTNGTAVAPAWTKVTALTPARMVLRIMVDPANSNRVFVTYGGYNSGNVWELTDATQVCKAAPTLANRHGNLPQAPVRSIQRHPTNPSWLYVGTDVGVFATIDGGTTWGATNDGPGSVAVDELFWLDPTNLVAATHGRGMFRTTLSAPGTPPILVGAASRKAHGGAGVFDLALGAAPTSPTTEPRAGPAHSIVFTFNKPVTAGSVMVTEGVATAGAPTFNASEMTVPLSGVTNQQYVTVSASSVVAADGGTGGTASARIGFLLGDVNGSRVVTVADLGLVNAQLAQPVSAANFIKDVNASGTLTVADKGVTNANLTKALPPP
jgi:hypothetical protein